MFLKKFTKFHQKLHKLLWKNHITFFKLTVKNAIYMNSTEIESRIIYLLLVVIFNPGEGEVKIEFHKKVFPVSKLCEYDYFKLKTGRGVIQKWTREKIKSKIIFMPPYHPCRQWYFRVIRVLIRIKLRNWVAIYKHPGTMHDQISDKCCYFSLSTYSW